jgi:hypothetical protein
MWCPSATLSVWANAWLAGQAAPDDVLDALTAWAPSQSVIAYDAVAAGNAGLPWPDPYGAGAMSLLQMVRTVAGDRPAPSVDVILPAPGDVRGLPAGTQFEHDALGAGEAMIVASPADPQTAVGLLPEPGDDRAGEQTLAWRVYALPGAPAPNHHDLGAAEYALRSAVRSAAEALTAIGLGPTDAGLADPRALVEQQLETSRHHRIPGHAPSRALRVLHNAAHVDAIVAVSAGLCGLPNGTRSSSEARLATDALRPLAAVVRSARMAAVSAIVDSAWRR